MRPARGRALAALIRMLFPALLLVLFPRAHAQTPDVTLSGLPVTPLIGEEFCFDVSFGNSGSATGYGPYVIAVVDPGVELLSIDFVDIAPRVEQIGVFDASGALVDPISGTTISGIEGGTAWLARYPVGSVDQGQPELVKTVCMQVLTGTAVGTPINIGITPGFEFGDTTIGTNGPLLGTPESSTVTPQLARISKSNSAPEEQRTPGPSHPFEYRWSADVSAGVSIDNLLLTDMLPAAIQWTGDPIALSAPLGVNCSITQTPNAPPTPGGTASVSCDSLLGAPGGDLSVAVPVYVSDVLDESIPDAQSITNTVDFAFDFQGTPFNDSDVSNLTAEHAAIEKSVSGTGLPGGRLTYVINFHLTDFPDAPAGAGANAFIIDDVLPDGLRYDTTTALIIDGNNVAITPSVSSGPGPGQTSVNWDIAGAVPGGVLPNGASGSLTFETTILDTYANGNPVQASDPFVNSPTLSYGLTQGGSGNDSSSAAASIVPNVSDKRVVSPSPLPDTLEPGTEVVFELSLSVPAGNTSDIVFTDFLPRPVFDVADFDAAADLVVLAPFTTLTPAVTTDSGTNSVRMEFGDISTPIDTVLRVQLRASIVGTPFADGLFLTNLLATSYRNTLDEVIDDLQAVGIGVGAPSLVVTKGVIASDNPSADISPTPPSDPGNITADSNISGVDAFDVIDYVVTVENIGSAPAFNVTIDETPASALNCAEPGNGDIVSGAGRVLDFSGNLSSGLRLEQPLAGNDGSPGAPYADDTALLTLRCTLTDTVEPLESIDNEAGAVWTSVPDPGSPFARVTDTAEAVIAAPAISKAIVDISPGYSSRTRSAHIGEIVTYELQIRIPEGTSSGSRLEDLLNSGLAFVDVLSVDTSSASLSSSLGSFADIASNAGFTNQGGGDVAQDRRLLFGPGSGDDGFGTITNSNTDNTIDEVIVVRYRARVLNASVNRSGRQRRNRARWLWQPDGARRSNVQVRANPVRVVEPRLRLRKVFSPNEGDESSPPRVTLTLDHNRGSTADAFDLALSDTLPDNLFVDGGIDTSTCAALPDSLTVSSTGSADALEANWAFFPQGSVCQISFQTRFGVNPGAGDSFNNCAESTWESLRDTDQPLPMPPNNVLGVERTGNEADPGQQNNYRLQSCDVFNVFGVGIEKTLVSSSQAHTDNIAGTPAGAESLTIGEEVTFELVVTIPDADVPELEVTDILPATDNVLEVISATTVSVGSDLTPSVANPVPAITDRDGDGVLDQVVLNYGAVTQLADGSTDEDDRIRIRVVAKVKDRLVNRNNNLTENTGLVRFSGLTASDDFALELVEPLLAIEKSADRSEAEAGDVVTYTVLIDHTPASRVEAQDVILADTVPDELNVIPSSVAVGDTCTAPPSSGPVFSGGVISAAWDRFPLSTVCEITFQATIDVSAVFGVPIINTADLQWTSLDTDGDVDDRPYDAQDNWRIAISEPGLGKALTATDVDETDLAPGIAVQELTIGETATFTLTANFPDGTLENVDLRDQLPTTDVALQITGTRIVSIGSDLTLSSGAAVGDAAADCSTVVVQNCALWTLGTVVNEPDLRPEPDQEDAVIVEIDMIVLDDAQNSGAPGEDKNLINSSRLTGSGISLSALSTFDIVEPRLSMQKLTENGLLPATVAAGETRRFTLRISHLPDSTAATPRAVITDSLNAELLWSGDNTVSSDCPGFAIDSSPASGSSGTVEFSIASFSPVDGRCEIAYDVTASAGLTVPGSFPNQASLNWESAPGSPESRQGNSSSENRLVSLNAATLSKVITGTSSTGTGASNGNALLDDVAIGERISYRIVQAFTEGTTSDVVIVDTLEALAPNGPSLELVSGGILFLGDQISTELPGTPVVGPGNVITVDYGDVTNVADLVSDENDTLVYELIARVADVSNNVSGVTLTNSVDLNFDGGMASADAVVELVEPVINADKQFTGLDGGIASIEIVVTNTGNSPAYELEFSDEFDETFWLPGTLLPLDVPEGFMLSESSVAGVTTVLLQTEGNPAKPEEVLDPGEAVTVRFSLALVNGGNDLGVSQIDNTVNVSATSLPGIETGERVYAASASDSLFFPQLAMTKTWSGPNSPARPGDTLTYTLTLENTGQAAATQLVIADDPDSVGDFLVGSVTSSSGGTVLVGNGPDDESVEVSFATLASGVSATVSYRVQVPLPYPGPDTPQQLSNQATADAAELAAVNSDDPGTATPGDATVVPIEADPLVRVSKDDQALIAAPGATIDYRIDYGNVGDQDATGVVISETVPGNTVFNATRSTPGWTCANGSGPGTRCDFAVGNLSITPGSVVFAVQVDASLPAGVSEITNTVDITDDGRENDPGAPVTPSTDSASEVTPLDGAFPLLTITKDDGDIGVTPGQRFSYLINYANIGNQGATGVVVTEVVPEDVVFSDTASAPTRWSCPNASPPGTVCATTIPLLPPGEADQLRFGLDVLAPVAAGRDLIANTVTIEDDGSNSPTPATATASDNTPLIAVPDIYVTKETEATAARVGESIRYRILFGNQGSQDATGVIVRETVPAGTRFNSVESSPTDWSCADGADAGTVCEYRGGAVAAGFMDQLFFGIDIVEVTPERSIVNQILANDDGNNGVEPTPPNNQDSLSVSFPSISIDTMSRTGLIILSLMLLSLARRFGRWR